MTDVSVVEWITAAAIAVVILMLLSLRTALSRLEARLNRMEKSMDSKPVQPPKPEDSDDQESAFEQFLAEDPARVSMPKSEQFAAYRQWRKDKGMNWSG